MKKPFAIAALSFVAAIAAIAVMDLIFALVSGSRWTDTVTSPPHVIMTVGVALLSAIVAFVESRRKILDQDFHPARNVKHTA